MKYKFLVPLSTEKQFRGKIYEFCKKNNFGFEIEAFTKPKIFYEKSKLNREINIYKKELSGINNFYSLHGPFYGMKSHYLDKDLLTVVEKRIRQSLNVSTEVGAELIVFHTGINPIITSDGYSELVIERQAKFWNKIVNEYENINICVENMWEQDTKLFEMLFDRVNSNNFKLCLDIGHLNVFSKVPLKKWFDILKNEIIHLHIADNYGKKDEHNALGDGNIDWDKVFNLIDELDNDPTILIEVDNEKKFFESLEFLKYKKLI